jgi:hypothetical protein
MSTPATPTAVSVLEALLSSSDEKVRLAAVTAHLRHADDVTQERAAAAGADRRFRVIVPQDSDAD